MRGTRRTERGSQEQSQWWSVMGRSASTQQTWLLALEGLLPRHLDLERAPTTLTEKGGLPTSTMCANMIYAQHLLSCWESGVLVAARQMLSTHLSIKTLGGESLMSFPSGEKFTRVTASCWEV